MTRRRRLPVSGAYAIALVSLFVALAGGAYAITLSKNNVKSKHIAKGAVKSVDIKNNNVKGVDVNESTLTGLQGDIRWAYVSLNGTVGPQSGGITLAGHNPPGVYRLDFGASAENHAILATPYHASTQVEAGICGGPPDPGSNCPGTSNTKNLVDVLTENSDGSPANAGFFVAAIP
jgi:hypothetical protein